MKVTLGSIVASAILGCLSAFGAPTQFTQHNFSMELPAGWTEMRPRPPLAVVALQSPDNSQRLLAFTVKLPPNERASGATDVRAGAKKSMSDNGWRIDPEQQLTINGQPFISFAGHVPTGEAITAYTTAANDTVYMLQAVRSATAGSDSEIQSAVRSFRLLSPGAALPLNTPPKSGAFRAGYVVGRILFFTTIPAVLLAVWAIRRSRRN
jgi:hypothetical protein